MINNAGLMLVDPMSDLKVDDWDRMIDVNLRGVLHGVAAVLPVMTAQARGHIVNVSSVAGHKVAPGFAVHYAIEQPADVDVNEILIRPTAQQF